MEDNPFSLREKVAGGRMRVHAFRAAGQNPNPLPEGEGTGHGTLPKGNGAGHGYLGAATACLPAICSTRAAWFFLVSWASPWT